MNADKALELAKSSYPHDENLRVAYMLGIDKGYEFCREDMLKDAVKGTVCKDKKSVWIELIPNALPDYEDIEPVKCVVMKEEQK